LATDHLLTDSDVMLLLIDKPKL